MTTETEWFVIITSHRRHAAQQATAHIMEQKLPNNKNSKWSFSQALLLGITVGAVGMAFGIALHNIGAGMCFGVAIGIGGAIVRKKTYKKYAD